MEDTAKYLIHADITADGVVERSDVVGAIFGQTEGLLGDGLDLRDLQQSSKVGRIDVDVESENGQSFGEVTITSSLDKVETATLAASLETIERVGPCRASVRISGIEDVRAAKRREVVDRAKELLNESFDDGVLDSREILEEVRQSVRVADITDYEGLPAGPHVADSDAVIVVEGRADVTTLLRYGVKNAVAVEGTNVPDAIADLTRDRTVTAFLDGDRGGDLILKELAQVGDVDAVAFAPSDRAVEDLSRHEVMTALREKVPYEVAVERPEESLAATDGSAEPAPDSADGGAGPESPGEPAADWTDGGPTPMPDAPGVDPGDDGESDADGTPTTDEGDAPEAPDAGDAVASEPPDATGDADATRSPAADATGAPVADPDATEGPNDTGDEAGPDAAAAEGESAESDVESAESDDESAGSEAGSDVVSAESEAGSAESEDEPRGSDDAHTPAETLRDHVSAVVDGSETVRLLDADHVMLAEAPAVEAFDAVESAESVPHAVVIDGELTQRVLDVAAQRGVAQVVARELGEFTKRPTGVRVRTADQLSA